MFDRLEPWLQKKCLGALRKICGRETLLPRSARISVDLNQSGSPLYRGGFADVWKGEYQGTQVAIKVIRIYSKSDFAKVQKVRFQTH